MGAGAQRSSVVQANPIEARLPHENAEHRSAQAFHSSNAPRWRRGQGHPAGGGKWCQEHVKKSILGRLFTM
jgi:hypothetical protein